MSLDKEFEEMVMENLKLSHLTAMDSTAPTLSCENTTCFNT